MVMISLLTPIVIQSEAKDLENIHDYTHHYVTEILRFALNDTLCKKVYCSQKKTAAF